MNKKVTQSQNSGFPQTVKWFHSVATTIQEGQFNAVAPHLIMHPLKACPLKNGGPLMLSFSVINIGPGSATDQLCWENSTRHRGFYQYDFCWTESTTKNS